MKSLDAIRSKKRRNTIREYINEYVDETKYDEGLCCFRSCATKLSVYNKYKFCHFHRKRMMKDQYLRTQVGVEL